LGDVDGCPLKYLVVGRDRVELFFSEKDQDRQTFLVRGPASLFLRFNHFKATFRDHLSTYLTSGVWSLVDLLIPSAAKCPQGSCHAIDRSRRAHRAYRNGHVGPVSLRSGRRLDYTHPNAASVLLVLAHSHIVAITNVSRALAITIGSPTES
jgi:hypothetical protein